MYLLEEEVIVDQLLLVGLAHTVEWVELTLEVTLESVASSDNLVHDLISLSLGDTWSKWVTSKVSSNSDSSGDNHSGIILGELSVLDTIGGHVGGVRSSWSVSVVVLDDLVEELVELGVSIMRSGVNTDSGVEVLDTGENACLEGNAFSAALVLVLLPDFLGEALAQLGLGSSWEESLEIYELIS